MYILKSYSFPQFSHFYVPWQHNRKNKKSPTPFGVGLFWQITVISIQYRKEDFVVNPLCCIGGSFFDWGGHFNFRGFIFTN